MNSFLIVLISASVFSCSNSRTPPANYWLVKETQGYDCNTGKESVRWPAGMLICAPQEQGSKLIFRDKKGRKQYVWREETTWDPRKTDRWKRVILDETIVSLEKRIAVAADAESQPRIVESIRKTLVAFDIVPKQTAQLSPKEITKALTDYSHLDR